MQVKVKPIHDKIQVLEYKHEGDAGADLRSCEFATILPGEIQLVHTGLSLEIPKGYEGQVRSRSGLALKGIIVANSPGTIDSNYRGEVGVILTNISKENFKISPGDRIAQLVIALVTTAEFIVVDTLEETERGSNGYGSSGIH